MSSIAIDQLSPAERDEIERRLATADADAQRGATWRQLRARLKQRLR
jgi:anti-sigma factor RsiW